MSKFAEKLIDNALRGNVKPTREATTKRRGKVKEAETDAYKALLQLKKDASAAINLAYKQSPDDADKLNRAIEKAEYGIPDLIDGILVQFGKLKK
jgi:hypothetical protein